MKIGAQLFTVHDFCKSTSEFAETLKKIADIGYTTVQVSGTCDYDAAWLKAELDKNGLECVLTHIPSDRIAKETKDVINDHNILNCRYIGLGWYDFSDGERSINDFANKHKAAAQAMAAEDKYFMYHNHDGELRKENGVTILEKLAQTFGSDEMGFTIDTYWIQHAGGDPARWIETLSGRVPCIHLKDCAYGPRFAAIGDGNINFDRIFEKAESAGTKYMLVEQDDCYGENPFDCLKRSYKYLHSLGFE